MCRGMPGGMKNIVQQAGARRTGRYGTKNYNNNDFFLLSRYRTKSRMMGVSKQMNERLKATEGPTESNGLVFDKRIV